MKHLVYTTIGYSKSYLVCLSTFLTTFLKYNSEYSILIIHDESFSSEIAKIVEQYPELVIQYLKVPDSTSSTDASVNKLKVFEFSDIDQYTNILYVDLDCIFQGSIKVFVENSLKEGILYTSPENFKLDSHLHDYWSLKTYTQSDLDMFQENSIYVFNAGCFLFKNDQKMKDNFSIILDQIKNHIGYFFYEQSFMNVYFNSRRLVDYSIVNPNNYTLCPDYSVTVHIPGIIVHFCGDPGNGMSKIERISNYLKTCM